MTVIYNLVTLGGTLVVGLVIAVQFGLWVTVGYLVFLALAGVGLLATVCARCGYYGRRCALGLGKVAALTFKTGGRGAIGVGDHGCLRRPGSLQHVYTGHGS